MRLVSDTASQDSTQDKSGPLLVDLLKEANAYSVQQQAIVADDIDAIQATVKHWCDQVKVDLVLVTGGTGFSARDTTPEVGNVMIMFLQHRLTCDVKRQSILFYQSTLQD